MTCEALCCTFLAGCTRAEDVEEMKEGVSHVKVAPVPNIKRMFEVHLSTDHHAFSLPRTCSHRSLASFYRLRRILEATQPYQQVPSLPWRQALWLRGPEHQATILATFLTECVATQEFLSNKALHLFLQTQLSVTRIKENMDGRQDDEVDDQACAVLLHVKLEGDCEVVRPVEVGWEEGWEEGWSRTSSRPSEEQEHSVLRALMEVIKTLLRCLRDPFYIVDSWYFS